MKAQDIVDELARYVPLFTDGFTNSLPVLSAVVSGDVCRLTTQGNHDLVEGQQVAISGITAPVQIDAANFLRTGSTATLPTIQEHDLTLSERDKAAGGKQITISGANEGEFTGSFLLIGVPDRNTLLIAVDDSGPTTISGAPLVDDANGAVFNGFVAASNVNSNSFEYTLPKEYPLNGVASAGVVQISIRVLSVLDIEQYIVDVHTRKEPTEATLVVELGDVSQSKNRNEQTDAADSSSGQYAYTPTLIQPFAVYIVQNATESLTGAELRDLCESEYIPAIFRAVLRAKFETGFSYSAFRATFTGHGVFAYSDNNGKNKALYAHQVNFEQLAQLSSVDARGPDETVAMRDVCYTLTTDAGEGVLTANVNLDENAEPEQ